MFPPPIPASSPFAHTGSRSNYQPQQCQSSPLSSTSSPTYNVQARRRSQHKPQGSSREKPQTHRVKLAKRDRARVVWMGREGSSENGASSECFEVEDDLEMGGDEDVFNDEIYRRAMLSETRRDQYTKRVLFEQEFGSSIDPDMYDDMNALEREMTGRTPQLRSPSPPSDDLDDALIQEYLAELEETERCDSGQKAMQTDTGQPGEPEREVVTEEYATYGDLQMSSPPPSYLIVS